MSQTRSDRTLRDSLFLVLNVLAGSCLLGALLTFAGGLQLGDPPVVAASVAFLMACGMLVGTATAHTLRRLPAEAVSQDAAEADGATAEDGAGASVQTPGAPSAPSSPAARPPMSRARILSMVQNVVAAIGAFATAFVIWLGWNLSMPALLPACIAGVLLLLAGGLAMLVGSYFQGIEEARLLEAPGLALGARVLAWVLFAAAASTLLAWSGRTHFVVALYALEILVIGDVWIDLSTRPPNPSDAPLQFPTRLAAFRVLGSRMNPLSSALDIAQRQMGIDLRSTWAIRLVRRSVEPLLLGILLVGWLSTCATVVGVDEQGLLERLGMPSAGPPLEPGLSVHWPWPIDRVVLIPVRHVQTLHVGHEEEAGNGPEDVLWARKHAENEYTLLLGNGRDLVSIDATIQFRIVDAFAWRYHCQNPTEALLAAGYRAVMKQTVNRTLAETLSENVAKVAVQLRAQVQNDADALGLGVEIVAFNVGAMHPPVEVATDYQAVVSAELGRTTASIDARAYANGIIPRAQAEVVERENKARAAAAVALGTAAGKAWAFRALEAEFHAAPADYLFRRRLETLEQALQGRRAVILDSRIQKDGGELWLTK